MAQTIDHRQQTLQVSGITGPHLAADRPPAVIEYGPGPESVCGPVGHSLLCTELSHGLSHFTLEIDGGGVDEDQSADDEPGVYTIRPKVGRGLQVL